MSMDWCLKSSISAFAGIQENNVIMSRDLVSHAYGECCDSSQMVWQQMELLA